MADCVVRVRGLSKSYGDTRALEDVSFDVSRGEVLAYLGPNGAGKTTTINILCGLLPRDAGSVGICGIDVARDPVAVKWRIGVVPEESNLYPELTCKRNLRYLGELYGLPRRVRTSRAAELLDDFGLSDAADRTFRTLSRGMKRRLTLAAALIHSPGILLLDEPTTGLDVQSARSLRAMIARVSAAGASVLLTTHNLAEAESLSDRVAILVRGRIVAHGTADEIKARAEQVKIVSVRFSGETTGESIRSGCPAVQSSRLVDGSWRLEVSDVHQAVLELASFGRVQGLEILDVARTRPTLEDAFVTIVDSDVDVPGGAP